LGPHRVGYAQPLRCHLSVIREATLVIAYLELQCWVHVKYDSENISHKSFRREEEKYSLMASPTCFISYSWEDEAHTKWVRILAEDLINNGVFVNLDQWDLHFGEDITHYMETCIRECDFILLICTPTFTEKANNEKGGVGYEKRIVTGEIYQGTHSSIKFVPIIRKGETSSLPSYLKSSFFLDFRGDEAYESNLEALLRHIYKKPKYVRPPLGPKPTFNPNIDYNLAGPKPPRSDSLTHGETIRIGFIASDTTALETAKPYLEQIIAPDLNEYAKSVGHDVNIEFLIDDAQGQANTHLEKIRGFHSIGVDLVIGGGWSSQALTSLSYINSNDMLLVSTTSTSPILAIPNDRLFRMCPSDNYIALYLADVMWAAGVKSIVIFQRGDSWGDGVVNQLIPLWTAKGGKIASDKIRYAAEATDFASYLTVADRLVKNAVAQYHGERQRVGVVILSFNEISVILKQVRNYSNIYNVHWWGSDGTAKSQRAMADAPEEANHIGIYNLLSRETLTPLYKQLESKYVALTKQQYGTYNAYLYDAAFAIVKAVIETNSTDASKVSAAFPNICNKMYGASGWCRLDSAGDRAAPPCDVWGFYPGSKKASVSVIMAQYNPDAEEIAEGRGTVFFPAILGYTPIGP